MSNLYESDESPLDCAGCAEPPTTAEIVAGKLTPLCSDCFHDSTFVCPDCSERHWSAYGVRVFVSPSLYCQPCAKVKDDGINASWQARQDEHRDEFQQRRR